MKENIKYISKYESIPGTHYAIVDDGVELGTPHVMLLDDDKVAFRDFDEDKYVVYTDTTIEDNVEIKKVKYLTFTGDAGGGTVGLRNSGNNALIIYYSFDNENYTQWDYSSISLDEGQSVYMYGDNPKKFTGYNYNEEDYFNHFVMTGKIKASGNIQSLISKDCPDEIPGIGYFKYLFRNCTSLTQAPELPATTLAGWCYGGMFYNCTSLTQAPELPATTAVPNCYQDMFYNCTSLTQAPELPATTLAERCYGGMFYNCTSLTQAPELPATTLTGWCYDGMFYNCTSLTQAPELPATKLADSCYGGMFYGCSKLNYIKVGATGWNTSYADSWVSGVSNTGTFVKPANTSISTGTSGIPEGWTVQNI